MPSFSALCLGKSEEPQLKRLGLGSTHGTGTKMHAGKSRGFYCYDFPPVTSEQPRNAGEVEHDTHVRNTYKV